MLTEYGKAVAEGRIPARKWPTVDREIDFRFRKELAQELCLAHRDAPPEVRPYLERALFNVGVVREEDGWILYHRDGRLWLCDAPKGGHWVKHVPEYGYWGVMTSDDCNVGEFDTQEEAEAEAVRLNAS